MVNVRGSVVRFQVVVAAAAVRHKKVLCMHAIDDEMRESIAAV
jgi:hypothetical protein